MEVEGWHYPMAIGGFKAGAPVFTGFWSYVPSLIEVAVSLLPFGLALLVISFMVKNYNFLPQKR